MSTDSKSMYTHSIVMVFWLLIFPLAATDAKAPDNCKNMAGEVMQVYRGWPVYLSCENFFFRDVFYDIPDYGDFVDSNFHCTIIETASGRAVLNGTTTVVSSGEYEYGHLNKEGFVYNATNADADVYTIMITAEADESICYYQEVRLNVSDFVQETCEQSRRHDDLVYPNEKRYGQTSTLSCEVLRSYDGPHDLAEKDRDGAKMRWLFNCLPSLPSNTSELWAPSGGKDELQLRIESADHQKHPGVYTCAVTYNGMTRYRIHHKICVKDEETRPLSISCPDYHVEVGEDVAVVCDVDAGLGHANDFSLVSKFVKLDENGRILVNSSCDTLTTEKNVSVSIYDDRHTCNLTIERLGDACHAEPPTEELRQAQRTRLKMFYWIRDVQPSDFGLYNASAQRYQHWFNKTFAIEKKVLPKWKIVVGILVPVGVLLFAVIILWFCCRVEVLLMKKRCFGSKEKEFKRYAGYLAYDYCEDMDKERSNNLKKFLDALNAHVKRLGGDLYDKSRVPEEKQGEAANIQAMLPQCYRVIILLTPEYIHSHWGMHQAYAAWTNVIEKGIPIIFFTFPKTKSAIELLEEQPRVALNNALKRHSVIKHDLDRPFNRRLTWKLEIRMPKLPRGGNLESAVVIDNYPAKANGTTGNNHLKDLPVVHGNGV